MREFGDNNEEVCIQAEHRTMRIPKALSIISVLAALLLLSGCAGITGVEFFPDFKPVCDPAGTVCGVPANRRIYFQINGQGSCGRIGINWGDGTQEFINGDFASTTSRSWIGATHVYPRAWPGPKIVHVFSADNCTGEARMRLNVLIEEVDAAGGISFSPAFKVGLAPTATAACGVPTNTRPLRAGATVFVSEIPGSPMINFGCWFQGCVHNMSGSSGPSGAGFSFPGMRRHSLVLRIVAANGQTQLVQGGTQTSFVVTRDGPLEFCVNDDNLADNTGGWGMNVSVDETTIP